MEREERQVARMIDLADELAVSDAVHVHLVVRSARGNQIGARREGYCKHVLAVVVHLDLPF